VKFFSIFTTVTTTDVSELVSSVTCGGHVV